jgi:transposase-like protein
MKYFSGGIAMDEITQTKNRFRMEHWMQLIKEQQTSGMSIKSWCQQNDIKEPSYYYWLKKIRKEACSRQTQAIQPAIRKPVEFAKLRMDAGTPGGGAAVIIHLPSAMVEVKEGVSPKTVEAVLRALKTLC